MPWFVLDLAVALFKLCDFGLSEQRIDLIDTMRRSLSLDGSQVVGTALYRAPELFYNPRTRTRVTSLMNDMYCIHAYFNVSDTGGVYLML